MKIRFIMTICLAFILCSTATVSALSIDWSDLTSGATAVSGDGWTATADNGSFQTKSQAGWTGVGISGITAGEIDTAEAIIFTFDVAQRVDDFTLTLLFSEGPYDDPNEVAGIIALDSDGNSYAYYLTAMYPAEAATWAEFGGAEVSGATIENLSPANTTSCAAVWRVSNPFGDMAISTLVFYAEGVTESGNDSDYCFNHMNTTAPVPEPATMILLGSGLLGLAGFRRKMK